MSAQPISRPIREAEDCELLPRANEEFNRIMNWQRAAKLEREERGNISRWKTK